MAQNISVLSREPEFLSCKTLEAFRIAAKNSKMNRNDECIATTNELAPYQDLTC